MTKATKQLIDRKKENIQWVYDNIFKFPKAKKKNMNLVDRKKEKIQWVYDNIFKFPKIKK